MESFTLNINLLISFITSYKYFRFIVDFLELFDLEDFFKINFNGQLIVFRASCECQAFETYRVFFFLGVNYLIQTYKRLWNK